MRDLKAFRIRRKRGHNKLVKGFVPDKDALVKCYLCLFTYEHDKPLGNESLQGKNIPIRAYFVTFAFYHISTKTLFNLT